MPLRLRGVSYYVVSEAENPPGGLKHANPNLHHSL